MPWAKNSPLEEPVRQLHRDRGLAAHHRCDRRFALADIEAELAESALEVTRVAPELFDELRLLLEHVDGGDACGNHRRRMRGREQERPRLVDQVIADNLRRRDVATHHADRLAQGADVEGDPAVEAEVVGGAPPVGTEHAGGMRVVDHHRSAVLLRSFHQIGKRCDVAVHAEDTVRHQQDAAISLTPSLTERALGILRIGVLVEDSFGFGQPDPVDDARVVELVADDTVPRIEHGPDDADVHRIPALEGERRIGALEGCQPALQLFVERLGPRDGAHRSSARTPFQRRARGRLHELRMRVETEIVVAGKADHGLAGDIHLGSLRRFEHTQRDGTARRAAARRDPRSGMRRVPGRLSMCPRSSPCDQRYPECRYSGVRVTFPHCPDFISSIAPSMSRSAKWWVISVRTSIAPSSTYAVTCFQVAGMRRPAMP